MDKIIPALQKCTLFKHKNTDDIRHLLTSISPKIEHYKDNETIFSPIQPADRIGILLSGVVDVQKIFPNGKIVIIERKQVSEVIGEASIFSKHTNYPDHVCACKPCDILFIQKADLLKLFVQDTGFMLNFLEATSNSTLLLKHKIGILSLDTIQEKIAGYLIHTVQHEIPPGHEKMVELPFSKKAWAESMNVSRTSLSRELRKLEQEGILSFEKRTIRIRDIDRLVKVVSL